MGSNQQQVLALLNTYESHPWCIWNQSYSRWRSSKARMLRHSIGLLAQHRSFSWTRSNQKMGDCEQKRFRGHFEECLRHVDSIGSFRTRASFTNNGGLPWNHFVCRSRLADNRFFGALISQLVSEFNLKRLTMSRAFLHNEARVTTFIHFPTRFCTRFSYKYSRLDRRALCGLHLNVKSSGAHLCREKQNK